MNIRDLQYFLAVIETGHFGKAAKLCHISQPALSMQLQKLESELGVTLLERTSNAVFPTDIGKRIAEPARTILNCVSDIKSLAKSAIDPFSGDIKLGIFPTLAPYFLPRIMPTLSKLYPKLSIYLFEEKTPVLLEQLKNGKLDAAFLTLPIHEKNLTSSLLFDEDFLLAVPKKHRLSKHKLISPDDLKNETVLLLEEGHCLRDQALAVCNRLRVKTHQHFYATSLETLRNMVLANVGITLMPKMACQKNKDIVYIPFKSGHFMRSVGLCWRSSTPRLALLTKLAQVFSEVDPT